MNEQQLPLTGCTLANTISVRRINERTSEIVWKKQGKVIFTERTVISVEAKILNATRVSFDAQGRPFRDDVREAVALDIACGDRRK